ncbi:aldo/keto reductase [Paenibacillus sacheonensis]|uniref:Aldo/keto reductase n=1 Tax=Paenibacillus sacheonensis TaxID=742054 RepID=A0A7X4YS96_9BACL|nr:aldo/keto reductase [Paenibacillus sacheonensis]MBM7566966.1 aryl-alcohol dehydrogenase-like predicted oxidoreductase [Paenibacillus sacheonensis]NBC71588.1 aldo/keto reductase [Paenibacillus sacheonensis]
MDYRLLGRSGLAVSVLGLGTNAFGKRADRAASTAIIDSALDSGINFIDTANIYAGTESETIIGHALKGKRGSVVLATKAGLPRREGPNGSGSSRYHLQRELEESLKRLQTDYVDLYQIHTFDPHTPLEETLRTLDDFIRAGKVRYIGASNYAAWELTKALGISAFQGFSRYISTQVSYSLADRTPERELVPACLDQGVGIIPYFPLAGGILSGKYASSPSGPAPKGSRAETDPNFNRFMGERELALGQKVADIANEHGCRPGALALAWLMAQPGVATVIAGATNPGQVEDNRSSLSITLTPALLAELDATSETFRHGEPFAVYRLP